MVYGWDVDSEIDFRRGGILVWIGTKVVFEGSGTRVWERLVNSSFNTCSKTYDSGGVKIDEDGGVHTIGVAVFAIDLEVFSGTSEVCAISSSSNRTSSPRTSLWVMSSDFSSNKVGLDLDFLCCLGFFETPPTIFNSLFPPLFGISTTSRVACTRIPKLGISRYPLMITLSIGT